MTPLECAKQSVAGDDFPSATIRGMLEAYDHRWRGVQETIRVHFVEKEFTGDLVNLRGSGTRVSTSRTFRLAGKVDKGGEQDGTAIWDHKTTSLDISDPDAPYWRQLDVEGQPSHYELLLHLNGVKVDRVTWDVVRKPSIKPKVIAKKDVAALASLGMYCGRSFDPQIAVEGMRETPELFEARVAQTMTENTDRYFQRRSVKRTRAELAEYANELWDIGQEIIAARRLDRWYRNSGACMLYGTPCQFLGICSGHDTPDSDRWVRKESVHEELETDGDGRDLLTNSRVRCFQTCRRKHFYQYELGIKRAGEEEKESLRFGSAWHDALDVYWSSFEGKSNGNSNGKPVVAVG